MLDNDVAKIINFGELLQKNIHIFDKYLSIKREMGIFFSLFICIAHMVLGIWVGVERYFAIRKLALMVWCVSVWLTVGPISIVAGVLPNHWFRSSVAMGSIMSGLTGSFASKSGSSYNPCQMSPGSLL